MEMKILKNDMRKEISGQIGRDARNVNREILREKLDGIFDRAIARQHANAQDSLKKQVIEAICDDILDWGPLTEVMADEEITEIMVNGPHSVYVEKNGKKVIAPIHFDDDNHLRYIVEKMISMTGRRVDESSPYVDFSLKDGSRVNVIIPPLAVGGAIITIRKMLKTLHTVDDLVPMKTLDSRMAQFLTACIKARINILFSGSTGSGKTTTLEVLSSYIEPEERIVTIEDTLELNLRQKHLVRLLTKPCNIEGKGEITMKDLFRNTLRMRPTRIILGEIRGEEAMDYLQALNSGHRGCLAVIHAARPSEAIHRLETLALYSGVNVNIVGIRRYISSGLNLIVQMEQFVDGTRKITYITEVGAVTDGGMPLRDIFRYEVDNVDDEDSHVNGRFKALACPGFMSLFKKKGIKIDPDIFNPDNSEYGREYLMK